MTGKSDDYIHHKFITDCVKENKMLDMEDYRQVLQCFQLSQMHLDSKRGKMRLV